MGFKNDTKGTKPTPVLGPQRNPISPTTPVLAPGGRSGQNTGSTSSPSPTGRTGGTTGTTAGRSVDPLQSFRNETKQLAEDLKKIKKYVPKPTPNIGGEGNPTPGNDIYTGVPLDNTDGTINSGGNPDIVIIPMPDPPTPPRATDLGVVKNPARDLTDIRSLVPNADESTITRLLFEQFSAVEIAQLLTPRTVDGIDQKYSVISNLSDIRRRYNSTKQLTVMDKLAPISGVFAIDIVSKIPGQKYIESNNLNTTYEYLDENDQIVYYEKGFIYIDSNGDLVIEFENMRDDEIIQVQIDSNGTIYEVTN